MEQQPSFPTMNSLSNRRQGQRFQRSFPVKCRVAKGTFQPTTALDISTTGLRMQANRNYSVGSQVTIHLKPAANQLMSLQAQVVWTSPKNSCNYEVGLHFTDGSKADFAWLQKWLLGSEFLVSGTGSFGDSDDSLLGQWSSSSFPIYDQVGIPERKIGDAPPLFSSSAPAIVEPGDYVPTTAEQVRWANEAPVNSNGACAHRCSCGAEFALKVHLAVHCQKEKHEAFSYEELAAPAPVVEAKNNANAMTYVKTMLVGGLVLASGFLVMAGASSFYSTWLPSIASTVHIVPDR